MELKLAEMKDLEPLKRVYDDIVRHMDESNMHIWYGGYPQEYFKEDIDKKRLYLLMDGEIIAAAFALCAKSEGAEQISWQRGRALYLSRFAVNTGYLKKGIGLMAAEAAKAAAAASGAELLRLFVVDKNLPALRLYEKAGFKRASGIYYEEDGPCTFREYGFELRLKPL